VSESSGYLTSKDGTKLFYQSWQPQKAEVSLLCIHGACSRSVEFSYLGEDLASKDVATYALDLRSNGQSGGERGDLPDIRIQLYDMDEMVDFIKNKWQKPTYILGHSLGSSYALWYGSEYSERLAGLVLVAPAIKVKMPLGMPAPLSDVWKFPIYSIFRPRGKWDVSRGWSKQFRDSEDAQYILSDEKCVKEFSFRYLLGLAKIGGKAGLKFASKINIPTLILQGTDDNMADPRGAQELYKRSATRSKEIRIFEDADHSLYGVFSFTPEAEVAKTMKEEVCTIVYEWLKACSHRSSV
jgi:alpha-beta hydrolase superfamily lysophospholipase